MCRRRAYWAGLVGCCLVAVAGCQRAESQVPQAGPPRVSVQHPQQRQIVDSDLYNGWLEAVQTVDVRARVRGHIQKVHFHDGDLVQQGQLLLELDPRPFQVAIDETLAQAKSFEAQKVAAEKQVARNREMVKSGAASQRELEKSEADALAYDAQINAKQQEAEKHKLDLEFSKILAPIAGRVSRAMLTEGNLVNAGGSDPVLTTIVSVDPIYVYFNIDERALQRYQQAVQGAGQDSTPIRDRKAAFFWGRDSEDGYPHEGLLDFADNRVDPATGTIEARGVVENDQGLFVPGSRVRVRLPVSENYQAIVVPDAAISTDQNQKYLLVVDEKKMVKRRTIRPGRLLEDGMRIVLESSPPLSPDDWVIVEGVQRARLNYPVEPVEETVPAAGPATADSAGESTAG